MRAELTRAQADVERMSAELETKNAKLAESEQLLNSNNQVRTLAPHAEPDPALGSARQWSRACVELIWLWLCQVITWLNKEVNEAQLGRRQFGKPPFSPTTAAAAATAGAGAGAGAAFNPSGTPTATPPRRVPAAGAAPPLSFLRKPGAPLICATRIRSGCVR